MRQLILPLIAAGVLSCLVVTGAQAQADAAKVYKANCELCHGTDGSGDTPSGKAMHAKDLRSDEVQKQSDAALNEVITKGKGKMPVFGARIKPVDVVKLVAYIRSLPPNK